MSFDKYTYQRKEADIDELRWAANSCPVGFLEDEARAVVPISILRTVATDKNIADSDTGHQEFETGTEKVANNAKIVSASKPESIMHLTKMGDGPLRTGGHYRRLLTWTYLPEKWAVFGDSEVVDTSGWVAQEEFDIWDGYVEGLQEGADEMDEWYEEDKDENEDLAVPSPDLDVSSNVEEDAGSNDAHANDDASSMLHSRATAARFFERKPLAHPEAELEQQQQQQHLGPRLQGLRSALKKTGVIPSLGSALQAYRPL